MAEGGGEANNVKNFKVLIIGAGIAGLSAANHLIKNSVNDFIILEARKRIGGRVFALEIDELKFEMGANWIHGVLGNPLYEIAISNSLVDILHVPKPHKVIAVTEEGKQIQFCILQETYEAYMCFLHRCEEYFDSDYLPPEGIESVGEHIELEIELYLQRIEDISERSLRRKLFDCLLKRETCIAGCHTMDEVSLLELGSYTELQGGNILLPSGFSRILQPIAHCIPDEKIRMEHAVAEIRWGCSCDPGNCDSDTDSDQTVIENETAARQNQKTLQNAEHRVRVTCTNGDTLSANHVICTIPLGVLKEKADSIFSPKLPEAKRESIDRLLFGTVNKIFLAYDRPFLHPDISEIMLLWNQDPNVKEDIPDSWFKKIYSFSKISDTVLLGWISGKEADYMETLSADEVSEKCTDILRKFLNDPYVPVPKLVVSSHWGKEEFTRGAYTSIAVGASQCDIDSIAQPLFCSQSNSEPLIVFAGEHCHRTFYSTVHGAYLSGRAAAKSLFPTPSPIDPPSSSLGILPPPDDGLTSWIRGISLEDS